MFPFVSIGPPGDTSVDYTGDDETPFNDALDYLSNTDGGTIYVRAGEYTIDSPVVLSGLTYIKIEGEGRGTTFVGGSTGGYFDVDGCNEAVIEHCAFHIGSVSSGLFLNLNDIDRFRFVNNLVSGSTYASYRVAEYGTDSVKESVFKNNFFYADATWYFAVFNPATAGTHNSISFEENYVHRLFMYYSDEVENLFLNNNHFVFQVRITPESAMGESHLSSPKTLLIENNSLDMTDGSGDKWINSNVSGAIIKANALYGYPYHAIRLDNLLSGSVGDEELGNFQMVMANVIGSTGDSSIGIQVYIRGGVAITGNVIVGNVCYCDESSSQVGIQTAGDHTIIDGNMLIGFDTSISDTGTGNYATGGVNQTSNKVG